MKIAEIRATTKGVNKMPYEIKNEEDEIIYEGLGNGIPLPEPDYLYEHDETVRTPMGSKAGVHILKRYTYKFSQALKDERLAAELIEKNARLDSEAQDDMFEYLKGTLTDRVMVLGNIYTKMTVKQLRSLANRMKCKLPNKAKKAEIVGILSHQEITRRDIYTVKNTTRLNADTMRNLVWDKPTGDA